MALFPEWVRKKMEGISDSSSVPANRQSNLPLPLMNLMTEIYPEPVAVFDRAKDRIVWVSAGLMVLSGRGSEELLKMKPADFIQEYFKLSEAVLQPYNQGIPDAQVFSPYKSPEGEKYVQALWMRLPKVEEGSDYFLFVLRDVTEVELLRQELLQYSEELQQQVAMADQLLAEREKAYLELREKSEQLRLISAATAYSNTMKFILTPDGTIVWVNKLFEKASGWSAEELIGKNVRDFGSTFAHLLPSPDAQPSESTLITNHLHRAPFTQEIFAYDRSGKGYWVLITVAPIPDEAGNITHYIGALINIHRKKQREEQLRLFQREIQESLAYAARIQKRFLSSPDVLKDYFSAYGIWHKPMLGIGGDFYHFEPMEGGIIIALGDCTGHGIPAALLSIYAATSLRFALLSHKQRLELVYQYLQDDIQNIFGGAEGSYEGFEVALLWYESAHNRATFIGMGRPLWILRGNTIMPLLSGRGDISAYSTNPATRTPPIPMSFSLQKGDRLYLFSDGITDQQNSQRKRFSTSRLQSLIQSTGHMPLSEQIAVIEHAITEWSTGVEQTDDLSLLALEI